MSYLDTFTTEGKKILEFLHAEYAKLQTGRANAIMVESAMVEAYGQKQPLKAVAGISVEGAKTITIQPWDKSILNAIEKALMTLDLGTSPVNDGMLIRINLPPMTEDRRKGLVKTVHHLAEEAKISIRNHRHEAKALIEKEDDEDVRYTTLDKLQKLVDDLNAKVEESMKAKEVEVMKI